MAKITGESCVSCGACCGAAHPKHTQYVGPLTIDDYIAFPAKVRDTLQQTKEGEFYMPNCADEFGNRCAYLDGELGVKVSCRIYGDRPGVCRDFEPGGWRCKEIRIMRGIDPLAKPAGKLRLKLLS